MKHFTILTAILALILIPPPLKAESRIKDVASITGLSNTQLIGYGLVTGLDGSGDRSSRSSALTLQTISNMLERFGITVDIDELKVRNAAAVMVTAELPPFARLGTRIDVNVSSLGDARSLHGGTLLITPMFTTDGTFIGYAQGPLSVGGFNFEAAGGEVLRQNHTQVGRIPGGGRVEVEIQKPLVNDWNLTLSLYNPDFTSALSMAQAVNGIFGEDVASALDASTVSISVPQEFRADGKLVEFISTVEMLEIEIDRAARVVVNERTGTIVIGQDVRISEVAVAHGNLSIQVSAVPVISQPQPFSQGQTVVTSEASISVNEPATNQTMVVNASASVSDIASALNMLGVSPRDIIAIFQAMKQAGALQAELVIM